MKKLLLVALCALLSANAEARTLYVDARRPNNNGNGRSLRRAKKTVQAAINIAKKGDTILVYPGTYGTITTNNKKIKIKSKSGASRTAIDFNYLIQLGKNVSGKGTSSTLSGFHLYSSDSSFEYEKGAFLRGGTVKSCILHVGVFRSKLTGCTLYLMTDGGNASLNRCKVLSERGVLSESKFANCLFASNARPESYERLKITYSTLVNCTVADNHDTELVFVKAYNTIFYGVPASQFVGSRHNTLKSCYRASNPKFVRPGSWKTEWIAKEYGEERRIIGAEVNWASDDDCGRVRVFGETDEDILSEAEAEVGMSDARYSIDDYIYERGEYSTTLAIGDYRLKKGSPCIDKGTKDKAAKKLFGTKDLAGKKRVKGKTVDIGCYEF